MDNGSASTRRPKKKRPKRLRALPRPLSIAQVLAWADADHALTGHWPKADSGEILSGPAGETWLRVNAALRLGLRGLPGGSSLAKLLAAERGVRNRKGLPPFTEGEIVHWAKNHHARTGQWPTQDTGPVEEAPGETWKEVNHALRDGRR